MDEDDCYLTGVCFVDLVDFDHDGKNELYLAYATPTQYWWYRYHYAIYGYDTKNKKAKKIVSGEVKGEEENLATRILLSEKTKSTNYYIVYSEGPNYRSDCKIKTIKNNKVKTLKTFSYSASKSQCYINGKKVLQNTYNKEFSKYYNGAKKYTVGYEGEFDDDVLNQMKIVESKTKKTKEKLSVVDISKVSISGLKKSYEYTGKAIYPQLILKYKGNKLVKGKDYTVKYKNNKKVGTATVTITGKGKYSGYVSKKFRIVKTPSIKLSREKVNLCLVNKRTATISASKKNISGTVKWKSEKTGVAIVKEGKITAKGRGTTIITAYIGKVKTTCKVTVTDTAVETKEFDCRSLEKWKEDINKKEREMVFGGSLVVKADNKTYYTGNIIVKREVLSYKTVEALVSINTPGYYRVERVSIPSKVRYTLHRHNLSNDFSSESIGKLLVNIVDQQLVFTQKCSCGLENEITWTIPIPDDTSSGEENALKIIPVEYPIGRN